MRTKLLALVLACGFFAAVPTTADAGLRIARTSRRIVNNYRRDVRQIQRQRTRTINQLDRVYRRNAPVRYGAPSRVYGRSNFGYPSSGLYLGGSRGGVFIRF